MKRTLLICSLILLTTGCTFKSSDQLSGNIDLKIESTLEADIKVGEKISGVGYETVVLGIFRIPNTKYTMHGVTSNATSASENFSYKPLSYMLNFVEFAKGKAVYDAITSTGSDLIINPQFTITEEDFILYKSIKCEVTGWKGTIKTIK